MGVPRRPGTSEDDPAVGEAKTELPQPRPRWTEDNLPTLPPDVRYEMLDEVGRGGMGKVMRAYDRRLDRPIAIKSMLGSREHVTRFLHEARITARLEHPGVVPVHDAGRLGGGEPFYAMKLVSGQSLGEAIETATGLAGRLALLSVIIDVAYTIAYAHSQGVIHRDLKPHNVLLGEYGETLVIDWGLSKEIGRDARRGGPLRRVDPLETADGGVLGTAAYMPPEQAHGEPLDYRADVWAIGALLYSLLTVRAPHEGRTTVEVLAAARTKTPRSIREIEPQAPPDLVAVAERAMATDREDRYAGALELAQDLKRYQTGRLVQARSYGIRDLAWHWVRRHLMVVVLATLLAVVIAGIAFLSVARVVSARETAVTERQRAESREALAQAQAAQLMLTEARAHLEQDPTAAMAGLKRLVASPAAHTVDLEQIRLIAADALSRGVIHHVMLGHTAQVHALACSDDGRLVYSLSDDGTLRAWDPERGTLVGQADSVTGRIYAFARNGDTVVTAEDDGLVVRDKTAKLIQRLSTGSAMHAVAVTKSRIYGGGDDGQLRVWPRGSGKPTDTSVGEPISAIAATDDGDVVAGTTSGKLSLWRSDADLANPSPIRADLQDRTQAIAFDPQKHVVAVTRTRFWDWDTEHAPRKLHESDNSMSFDIAISADNHWLGLANGRDALLIDRTDPQATPVKYNISDGVAFSPSGRFAAFTEREGLVVRDLVTGVDRKLALFRNAVPVRFATDSRVIVGGVDGQVFVLDIAPLLPVDAWSFGAPARAVTVSPDGASIATFTFDRKVHELDVKTRTRHEHQFDSKILAVLYTREPHVAYVNHGPVTRLDLTTDARTVVVPNSDPLYCLASRADLLAFGDINRRLHVRDLASGQESVFAQPDVVIGCEFADDGSIVVGTDASHVRRIDATTGAVLADDTSHHGAVTGVAALPDGAIASISTDGTARVFRGGKSTLLAQHDMPLWGLGFGASRGWIATAGSDRSVRITDRDGHVVRIFRGHTDDVSGVAFSPDGAWIASSSLDGTVRRWAIDGDSPPHTLPALATWLDQHTSVKPVD